MHGRRPKTKVSGRDASTSLIYQTHQDNASESAWFSFIVYKSKKHRDQVNKKVMDYFSKKYAGKEDSPMPFDIKRMTYGGFKVVVDK